MDLKLNRANRCTFVSQSTNIRCSRYAKRNAAPGTDDALFCSVHHPNANLNGIIAKQRTKKQLRQIAAVTDDPMELLWLLSKSENENVQIRALDLLMTWKAKQDGGQCPKCKARDDHDRNNQIDVDFCTEDEIARFVELFAAYDEHKAAIQQRVSRLSYDEKTQLRRNNTRVRDQGDGFDPDPDDFEPKPGDEPTQTEMERRAADAMHEREEDRQRDAERERRAKACLTAAPQPKTLSPDLYPAVGIFQMPETKAWTHALGDQHCADIIEGRIPYADARAAHEEALRQSTAMDNTDY